LRAVVFDFGMVLSGQPNQAAHAAMIRITGLPFERFEALYWADRQAYDEGKMSGIAFWEKLVSDAGLNFGPADVAELNRLDGLYWTSYNPAMLEWQAALKQRGLRTGILSNMGDTVLASIEREFQWLGRFDALVWSFQHGIAKPDPAIYHLVLDDLGTKPEETLFLDDKKVNTDAARDLGMRALEFTTIERLREDLVAAGLDRELPLPG